MDQRKAERGMNMKTNWTECEKKLPEGKGVYLVSTTGYYGVRRREILFFENNERPRWFKIDSGVEWETKNVTHWMELPELPEE